MNSIDLTNAPQLTKLRGIVRSAAPAAASQCLVSPLQSLSLAREGRRLTKGFCLPFSAAKALDVQYVRLPSRVQNPFPVANTVSPVRIAVPLALANRPVPPTAVSP